MTQRSAAVAWLLLALGLLLHAPVRAAEEPPASALQTGTTHLREGRFEDALASFRQASAAAPDDPRPRFFEGVALNRLGRFADAEASLLAAIERGLDRPDLPFERGWSLLGQERFAEALPHLDAYESARPGRGQTSEFRGRALYGLERLDEARAAFQEALRRDPDLEPTVSVYLAALAEKQGDPATADALVERLTRDFEATPVGGMLARRGPGAAPVGGVSPDKPWRLFLSLGGGHNSNVVALPDDFALPTDISNQAAGYVESYLDGSYHWFLNPEGDQLYVGTLMQTDNYASLESFNQLDNTLYLGYRGQVSENLFVGVRAAASFTSVGGQAFRREAQLRPSLALRQGAWGALEGALAVTSADYLLLFPGPLDRDATTTTASLTQYFFPPDTRLEGRVGYYHSWNAAVGSDFDLESDGLFAGLSHPLFGGLGADVSYQHSWDSYTQPNSLAGPSGFGFRRQDDYGTFTAQLRQRLSDQATLFVRWNTASNVSNIPFYGYDRSLWQSGVYFDL